MTKILCIDDEPDILTVMQSILEMQGYDVVVAKNGAEGLQVVQHGEIDLVVSDVRMPIMNGVDFLKNLLQLDLPSTPPVILLTGYADFTEEEVKTAGAYALLIKPHDIGFLVDTVKEALAKKNNTPISS